MVSLPLLAVVYDASSPSPMELLAQVRGSCRLLWIAHLDDPALGARSRLLTRSGDVLDTGGAPPTDLAAVVTASPAADGLAGVVAFSDAQLAGAAHVAAALGLPGNPVDVVDRLRDKAEQRRALAAAGLPTPAFRIVATDRHSVAGDDVVGHRDLTDILDAVPAPVVVKPLHGESSRDVVRAADSGQLAAALDALAATGTELALVEEYLADRGAPPAPGLAGYVSVEVVVDPDGIVPVAITGKFPLAPPFRETGNFLPHPLDRTEADAVLSLATDAAAALGVRSGVLHIEIKLTPDGPRIIEVNGRVGGGAIDLLVERRTGRSLTARAVAVALGRPHESTPEAPAEHAGPFLYEHFVQPPIDATRLRSIGRPDALIGIAGATEVAPNRSVGDVLDWRAGSQGYLLRVSGTAADVRELGSVPTATADLLGAEYD